jgi:invasion protein IalB
LAESTNRGYALQKRGFAVIRGLHQGDTMPARRFAILISIFIAAISTAAAQTKSTTEKSSPAKQQKAQPTANSPTAIAQYGEWGVYVSQAPRTKVCYALAQPKDRLPANLKRDAGYLFISSRPGENVRNEVSVIVGFTIKEGSEATLEVGDGKFSLYTKGDGAWVRNAAEEARLVDSLRKGRELVVKATSARGNVTTDRYALSGLPQALDRVAQECR